MRKIPLDKLDLLFAKIAEKQSLYIPSDSTEGAKFAKWTEGTPLTSQLNTARGIKDFFFPQSEDLMKFKMQGKSIEVIDIRDEHKDFVIFGARACDVRAMEVLDRVFLHTEPVDTYYKNRREHGIIMSLACTRPAETCFCGTFGIDAANPDGDIVCYKTDDALYMNAVSEKGAALLNSLSDIAEDADTKAVDEQKNLIKERMAKLPLANLTTDSFGGGKTDNFFDSDEWEKLSESCLGCGTCTFVCPTCQCYDIRDFKTNDGVVRYRCWDSCMYSQFTRMAHGNNRNSQKERFRQRFMHKLVYFPENNNGMFSCVGCGRCLAKCPISMNIVKVMKALEGTDNG